MGTTPQVVSIDGHMYFFVLPVSAEVAHDLAIAARGCHGIAASTCGGDDNRRFIAVMLSSNYWFDARLQQEQIDRSLADVWDCFISRNIATEPMPLPMHANPCDMLPS